MSHILYSDYSRPIPLLASSKEIEKRLNTTMTIFLLYHTLSSAANFFCCMLYVLCSTYALGLCNAVLLYARIVEFLRNLYMFLPPIVVISVTLDRLLTLLLNIRYNARIKRMIVRVDLLCLALMALIVAHYNYYRELAYLLIPIGVTFMDPKGDWRPRFTALFILKAFLNGLNIFNCFAFMFQLRKLPKLKVVSLEIVTVNSPILPCL
ncbi:hypothetical protein DdX_17400 [Ditylenchus destructor]|uniref:Uncharacterized protein n=1 Tax=Ditylenchus destructor TaxID=166010 RepID=A0AAD4MN29_9BILA|nr:hypothetical protein DdX_17400 [Ditylenchus destructor]